MKSAFYIWSVLFTVAALAQAPTSEQNREAVAPATPVTLVAQSRFPGRQETPEEDAAMKRMKEDQLRAQNKKRQEDLKKDADKLLQLATELKLSVDKSNEHTLSLEVVNKCDEIEKLARSVKNKMKGQ
jgi:hypothetical protein